MNNLASRTALAFLAVFTAAGCVDPGERAATGLCPAGETCSSEAPQGLFFVGTPMADSLAPDIGVTAKGGTHSIKALLNDTSDGKDSEDSDPFDKDFEAATVDAKVATIKDVTPPDVLVSGKGDGDTLLRLVEPGTNNLLDRVTIQVASIAKVSVFPLDLFLVAPDDAAWTLVAGDTAPLMVRLQRSNGDRLIDESLTMTPSAGKPTKQSWDLFGLEAPASGDTELAITAGGQSFSAKAATAPALDAIVPSKFLNDIVENNKLEVMTDQLYCFLAQAGGVNASGATWKFSGSANLKLTPPNPGLLTKTLRSCVQVNGSEVGSATLTVAADAITKTFDLALVKKSGRRPRGQEILEAPLPRRAPRAGERAALVAND